MMPLAGQLAPLTSPRRSAGTTPRPSGLTAQYLMTEGSGSTVGDTSGNGYHGSFGTVAPTWAAEGLVFGGTLASVVNLPAAAAAGVQSCTFAAVARLSAAGNFPYLFGSAPQDQGLVLLCSGSTRQPQLYVQTTAGTGSIVSPSALTLSQWYSIIGVRTYNATPGASRLDLYVNGTLVNGTTTAGSTRSAITTLRLGWGGAAGTATLIGTMALAETYAAALSAGDVASLHAAYVADLSSRGISF